jgi:O-antigen ligase
MKQSAPVNKIVRILSGITAAILLLVPFHALLSVWLASNFGHYTLLRLWKEALLVPLALGAIYILARDRALRQRFLGSWLVRLIFIYFALLIVCGLAARAGHTVSAKALWYGLLVDARFLVFFLAVSLVAVKSDWLERRWTKLLLVPAIFVAAFAVLQYLVLPYDFLRHLGYGDSTISPYETINHNIHHLRAASTLRGANPLGAFLIVPLCALGVWLLREKRERFDKFILGGGLLLALAFSFSRSAWIGALISLLTLAWLSLKSPTARHKVILGLIILAAAGVLAAIGLRNNLSFQDTFLHTDKASTAAQSSNYGHSAAFRGAVKDIAHHPLGGGVGTAGPQSFYNDRPARIAENYYLQVGQETGILGMALFIAIIILLGRGLYAQRADPLALALLAALIGLSLVNVLSHAWEDDTLAYVFWGLAGIAYAPIIGIKERHAPKKQIKA